MNAPIQNLMQQRRIVYTYVEVEPSRANVSFTHHYHVEVIDAGGEVSREQVLKEAHGRVSLACTNGLTLADTSNPDHIVVIPPGAIVRADIYI